MSFRELTMIDVKEVLRRWAAGQSARQIARDGVVSRRTASRYIEAATSLGLMPSDELTDERVRGVAQGVQARPLPPVAAASARALIEVTVQTPYWLVMIPLYVIPATLVGDERAERWLSRATPYLYCQMFTGCGETLMTDERSPTTFRIGIADRSTHSE